MTWQVFAIAANVLHEQAIDVAMRSGSERNDNERSSFRYLLHDRSGNDLGFDEDTASIFEPLERPIEFECFFRGPSDGLQTALPCRLAGNLPEAAHDGNFLLGRRLRDIHASCGKYRVCPLRK